MLFPLSFAVIAIIINTNLSDPKYTKDTQKDMFTISNMLLNIIHNAVIIISHYFIIMHNNNKSEMFE
jgi:hypothetical protein